MLKDCSKLVMVAICLALAIICHATTRTVSLDGTQQYTSIQAAINASINGDTVLVYPGRYLGSIAFNSKNITLASLEMTTGDTGYIASTILDGNQAGSVVRIINGESAVTVRGFVITNGTGTPYSLGRYGGGFQIGNLADQSNINIINCSIYDNRADYGGGICSYDCNLNLSGSSIRSNEATVQGGGIFLQDWNSEPQNNNLNFDPNIRCSIYNNYSGMGTEIASFWERYINVVVDTFTVERPDNYYVAMMPYSGFLQDTYFDYDVQHFVYTETNSDIYVSPEGDDSNSGLTPAEPMKTIAKAIYKIAPDSLNPKTVHLAPGIYSKTLNGQKFPVAPKKYMRLIGDSPQTTILDGDVNGRMITSLPYDEDIVIANITIRRYLQSLNMMYSNRILIDNVIVENTQHSHGAGINSYETNYLTITNSIIRDCSSNEIHTGIYIIRNYLECIIDNVVIDNIENSDVIPALTFSGQGYLDINRLTISNITDTGDWGNAIMQVGPDRTIGYYPDFHFKIANSLFCGIDQTRDMQMGLVISSTDVSEISNCTFVNNTGAGTVLLYLYGDIIVKNNVFYNNTTYASIGAPDLSIDGIYTNLYLANNDIEDLLSGVLVAPVNNVFWQEGNIDIDPLFSGSESSPYYLSSASPLIDAGTPDTTGMALGLYDVAGNERIWDGNNDGIARIDIGAYEYQPMNSPENLTASLGLNYVHLSWGMEAEGSKLWVPACAGTKGTGMAKLQGSRMSPGDRALTGYRVYRDSMAIADIDSPQTLDYIDRAFTESDTVTYYVVALYGTVESEASNPISVYLEYVHNEDNASPLLSSFSISPNPFVNHTIIRYTIGKAATVDLVVCNIKGQVVKTISSAPQNKGDKLTYWDGRDETGKPCSSGIYLVKLSLDGKAVSSKKVTLLK